MTSGIIKGYTGNVVRYNPKRGHVTVARVEIVKGKSSTPMTRLEELIDREVSWKPGDDPLEHFNVRGNWTNRKFGVSPFYRNVADAVCGMLKLNSDEKQKWSGEFFRPMAQ